MSHAPGSNEPAEWNARSILASLVSDSPQAVFGLDEDGRIVTANAAAYALTGVTPAELTGQLLDDVLGPRFSSHLADAARHVRSNEPVAFATTAMTRAAGARPVYATILPERSGEVAIALYVLVTPATPTATSTLPPDIGEATMDAIFNAGATAILLFDLDGVIFAANPALQRMLAYDVATLRGMNVLDLVHAADRLLPGASGADPFADLVAGTRDHYQAIRRYRHSDGHLIWTQVTVYAARDGAGEIAYFIAVLQDVTELKLLEDVAVIANETTGSFEAALETIVRELAIQLGFQAAHVLVAQERTNRVLPTGIWYLEDPDMLPKFCDLTRATTFSPGAGHVGKVFASRVATLDRDLPSSTDSLRIAAAVEDGLRTGLFVPMIIHGDVVGIIEFYAQHDRDVDPALLSALTRIAPQLGWFVERERARAALEQKSEELERSNRDLDRFASVASHDLQEPLRAIGRCAELLKERHAGKLDEDAGQLMHFILDGAERMEAMVADLLRYSRISTGAREFTLIDLNEVVTDVLQDLRVAIEENDATVEVAELPAVQGNFAQLHSVFLNLIGNALKYRGDTPPVVKIDARIRGAAWLFAVRDNGIGIAPAYHDQIFEIFRRLHGRNQYTGTGIGLAIVKRIIEQHHGRLWVESEEDRGSTFFFTLPVPGGDTRYDGDTGAPEDRPPR